jgi:acyl-homoserine lactone acylase PvdQ
VTRARVRSPHALRTAAPAGIPSGSPAPPGRRIPVDRRTLALGLALAAALAACAVPGASAVAPTVAPYGTNDSGGFRNVLPPGENGLVTLNEFLANGQNGSLPPHFADQQPLYENLLYASPHLTHAQIGDYFKDATFGVHPADVASTESPRPGVTIVRDRQYGVPHIYGATRGDVSFGAGYAAGEDRLFFMDVLRHTARAQLSSFLGGAAGNRAMDRTEWAFAPYTEQDLQSQLDALPRQYGAAGVALVGDLNEMVAGINAYVDQAVADPSKMPVEYAGVGQMPTHWSTRDVVALASLLVNMVGIGGGGELGSAMVEQAFERRFGSLAGRRAWSDFRSKDDPEAPTTIRAAFPYEDGSPFSPRGLAMPDPGSVSLTPVGAPLPGARRSAGGAAAGGGISQDGSVGSRLLTRLGSGRRVASNWALVSARRSVTGHALAVGGPQLGYYVPEILMEEDLHGPGIDARGTAFPGINLFVQIGHGRDYAWTSTSGGSDDIDTFAEVLCQDSHHYLYRGRCRAMERLDRANAWSPNVGDPTPAGSETLSAWRTVHGIVYARGTLHGRPVAFAHARTTYFHEIESEIGFQKLNDPAFVTSPRRFMQAASQVNISVNWGYVDADHIAYYQSGLYPQRAPDTSPDFPILGTGPFDWRGYDPATHALTPLPFAAHPHALDPSFAVSWNNRQAPRWSAADNTYSYGPVYHSQMIEAGIVRALRAGHGRMRVEQVVQAVEDAGTTDIRPFALWRILRPVLGLPADPRLRAAIGALDAWARGGGHRRDLGHTGVDENNQAITIMDAWWPRLVTAMFKPALGSRAFDALRSMLALNAFSAGAGQPPAPPDFSDDWYGYVSKDLRDLLARSPSGSVGGHRPRLPRGAYSRTYCGRGSVSACRQILRRTLLAALTVTPKQLYGFGYCTTNPQASCFDQNSFLVTGAIGLPNFPFQNRSTFQQVAQPTRLLGR